MKRNGNSESKKEIKKNVQKKNFFLIEFFAEKENFINDGWWRKPTGTGRSVSHLNYFHLLQYYKTDEKCVQWWYFSFSFYLSLSSLIILFYPDTVHSYHGISVNTVIALINCGWNGTKWHFSPVLTPIFLNIIPPHHVQLTPPPSPVLRPPTPRKPYLKRNKSKLCNNFYWRISTDFNVNKFTSISRSAISHTLINHSSFISLSLCLPYFYNNCENYLLIIQK